MSDERTLSEVIEELRDPATRMYVEVHDLRRVLATASRAEAAEAEVARLRAALERIASVRAGGPHMSVADGMSTALASLDRCRDIARAALGEPS